MYENPQRGPDGRFQPIEQVGPLNDEFIGGFNAGLNLNGAPPNRPPHPHPPPLLPPRPFDGGQNQHRQDGLPKYGYGAPPYGRSDGRGSMQQDPRRSASTSSYGSGLAQLSAVERSKILRSVRMDPVLQYMVGPLLKYDTVDEKDIWHGACLIVSKCNVGHILRALFLTITLYSAADAGSIYEPHPMLTYEWDPENPLQSTRRHQSNSPFDLGPHPADPHSTVSSLNVDSNSQHSTSHQNEHVPGHEIWVYEGIGG